MKDIKNNGIWNSWCSKQFTPAKIFFVFWDLHIFKTFFVLLLNMRRWFKKQAWMIIYFTLCRISLFHEEKYRNHIHTDIQTRKEKDKPTEPIKYHGNWFSITFSFVIFSCRSHIELIPNIKKKTILEGFKASNTHF